MRHAATPLGVGGKEHVSDEGGGGGGGWRKLVQRKRRQSSKKRWGRREVGVGRGLLPFTLVSPMLASLIVMFCNNTTEKPSKQQNYDKSKISSFFFLFVFCFHTLPHMPTWALSPVVPTHSTQTTQREQRGESYLGYGPNRGILLQAGSIGGIN